MAMDLVRVLTRQITQPVISKAVVLTWFGVIGPFHPPYYWSSILVIPKRRLHTSSDWRRGTGGWRNIIQLTNMNQSFEE